MDTVVYVDEQRMIRSDCTDTELDLYCPQTAKGPFSCIAHHTVIVLDMAITEVTV